jgi:cell division protein ZapD
MSTKHSNLITYEHTSSEIVRVYLILESLFQRIENEFDKDDTLSPKVVTEALVEISCILDRSDLKDKLAKQLISYIDMLSQYIDMDAVDSESLMHTLQKLKSGVEYLDKAPGKLNAEICQDNFFDDIRVSLRKYNGTRDLNSTRYHLWLEKPLEIQLNHLFRWHSMFVRLSEIISLVLLIMRDSSSMTSVTAENGFYQQSFESSSDFKILQLTLDKHINAFPDIRIGNNRLSIHFLTEDSEHKPSQYQRSVNFELKLCA